MDLACVLRLLVGSFLCVAVSGVDFIVDVYRDDAPSPDLSPSPNINTTAPFPPPDPEDVEFLDRFCKSVTRDVSSSFLSPSYPMVELSPLLCQYVVVPKQGFCALRVDFIDAVFTPRGQEGCSSDTFQILNSLDKPAVPQCGFMAGFQYTVRTALGKDVTLLVTSQSETKWNISVTQIPCSNIQAAADSLPKDCGKAGDPMELRGGVAEAIKLVQPMELLRDDNTSFPFVDTKAPDALLRKAVVGFSQSLKIVNGNETGLNEYPWQVLILALGKPLCGGSLISDQFVLTAGHCTSVSANVPLASLLIVDLGDHDLTNAKESPNKVYRVEKIIPHIKHDVVHSDIALIKLSKKVEFSKAISPICLPKIKSKAQTYEGDIAYTSGWGKTGDSVISPVLRKAKVEIVPLDICRQLWELVGSGGSDVVESSMICAGGGNVGPCNGDSGGPLIVKDDVEDKYNLIGITSFGSLRGCALEGVPTVFTRVTSFLDWILLNIAQT